MENRMENLRLSRKCTLRRYTPIGLREELTLAPRLRAVASMNRNVRNKVKTRKKK